MNSITEGIRKYTKNAVLNLANKVYPTRQGELVGFRGGLNVNTLIKENGDLIPGHDGGVFVEGGKELDKAKDALSWGTSLNIRKQQFAEQFGTQHEVKEDKLALIAVFRKLDSDDFNYYKSKLSDLAPIPEHKQQDDSYDGVTPLIGKVSKEHYIGVPMKGESEVELLKSAQKVIEIHDSHDCKHTAFKLIANNQVSSKDSLKQGLSLSKRRELKKESNDDLKVESKKVQEKMLDNKQNRSFTRSKSF